MGGGFGIMDGGFGGAGLVLATALFGVRVTVVPLATLMATR